MDQLKDVGALNGCISLDTPIDGYLSGESALNGELCFDGSLQGQIALNNSLAGYLSNNASLHGELSSGAIVVIPEDPYIGDYVVDSTVLSDKILKTKNKVLMDNVTIKPVPTYEVSNTSGGYTFYIGKVGGED